MLCLHATFSCNHLSKNVHPVALIIDNDELSKFLGFFLMMNFFRELRTGYGRI